jgi:hypothetical protein
MSLRLGASRARDLPQPSTYARSWPHLTQQTRSGRRRRRWNRIQRHTSRRRHRRRNGGQRLHPWRRVRINCDLAPLDCLGAQLTHESRKIRIRYGVMMRSRFSGASKVSCRVNRATAQDGRRRIPPQLRPIQDGFNPAPNSSSTQGSSSKAVPRPSRPNPYLSSKPGGR